MGLHHSLYVGTVNMSNEGTQAKSLTGNKRFVLFSFPLSLKSTTYLQNSVSGPKQWRTWQRRTIVIPFTPQVMMAHLLRAGLRARDAWGIFSSHHHKFHKAFHRTNPPSPHLMVLSLDYELGYKKEEDEEILFLRSSQPSYVHGVEYHCLRPQTVICYHGLKTDQKDFLFSITLKK